MIKKIKIVSVHKDIHQETNSYFLDVTVNLLDIDESLVTEENDGVIKTETLKRAYNFGTPAEEIKQDLLKVLALSVSEDEAKILNAETEKLNNEADQTISELDGFEDAVDFELPVVEPANGDGSGQS